MTHTYRHLQFRLTYVLLGGSSVRTTPLSLERPRVNTTVTTATEMISILSMDSEKSASGEERAKNIPIM